MKAVRTWLLVACSAWLSGCGASSDAVAGNGGGGIEIPNGLLVTVVDGAGAPLQGVRVQHLAGSRWGEFAGSGVGVVIDSGVTDGHGQLQWPNSGADGWIEARTGGKGVRLRVDSAGAVQAQIGDSLHVLEWRWPDSLSVPPRLWLAGTNRSVVPTAAGVFRFDSLPEGDYSFVAQTQSGLHGVGTAILGNQGLERFELGMDTGGMLVDDFEDGDVRWKPVALFGNGYWWRMANTSQGGLQAVFGESDIAKSVISDGSGRYLSMRVSTAAMGASPWANFGVSLGAGYVFPDQRKMTAVRMKVRGKGVWTLGLSIRSSIGVELWRTTALSIDTSWQVLRLPASAFARAEGTETGTWGAMRRWITTPIFQTSQDGFLEIDDLVFEGIAIGDWSRPE